MGSKVEKGMASGSFKDGKSYWDAQYKADSSDFDWYQQYGHLEVLLAGFDNNATVLITGSGTSKIGVELANRGVATVNHIEQSPHAVNAMKSRYGNTGVTFTEGDVTSMPFNNESYDIVIDKACLDAILCEEGGTRKSQLYLNQVARVLKESGKFVCVSTGKKELRGSYFEQHFGDMQVDAISKPSSQPIEDVNAPKHWVYVCTQPKP